MCSIDVSQLQHQSRSVYVCLCLDSIGCLHCCVYSILCVSLWVSVLSALLLLEAASVCSPFTLICITAVYCYRLFACIVSLQEITQNRYINM